MPKYTTEREYGVNNAEFHNEQFATEVAIDLNDLDDVSVRDTNKQFLWDEDQQTARIFLEVDGDDFIRIITLSFNDDIEEDTDESITVGAILRFNPSSVDDEVIGARISETHQAWIHTKQIVTDMLSEDYDADIVVQV